MSLLLILHVLSSCSFRVYSICCILRITFNPAHCLHAANDDKAVSAIWSPSSSDPAAPPALRHHSHLPLAVCNVRNVDDGVLRRNAFEEIAKSRGAGRRQRAPGPPALEGCVCALQAEEEEMVCSDRPSYRDLVCSGIWQMCSFDLIILSMI